jgi:AmmeMemoRadiSam system protein A
VISMNRLLLGIIVGFFAFWEVFCMANENIIKAYVLPHPPVVVSEVGGGREAEIQATVDGFKTVAKEIGQLKPDTIIVISPHSLMYSDYFHVSPRAGATGNFARFGQKGIRFEVKYDQELVGLIEEMAHEAGFPAGCKGDRQPELDHGVMVPLYFVDKEYKDYKLVRIGLSSLPLSKHVEFGQIIKKAIDRLNKRVVLIASGDLSHCLKEDGPYGFNPKGPVYDKKVMEVLARGELEKLEEFDEILCAEAAECGHRSFVIMSGILKDVQLTAKQLSYEGTFGVGYGICTFDILKTKFKSHAQTLEKRKDENKMTENIYVKLARESIEHYLKTRRVLDIPDYVTPEMRNKKAGVFVTLYLNNELRGCIGTITAGRENIAKEIIVNAINAASKDPRFSPLMPYELEFLVVSVDVLGEIEPVSSHANLDPKKYGIIVSKAGRKGLLLPNLDGVDTVEAQILVAMQKAGISETEKDVKLERFEVIRHK